MIAGPRITMNRTGRKNTIIGTVSLAGSEPAFFSAAAIRRSRFSCAAIRRAAVSGVPYLSAWTSVVHTALTLGRPVRRTRLSRAWRRSGR
jgi:hypothetical protein